MPLDVADLYVKCKAISERFCDLLIHSCSFCVILSITIIGVIQKQQWLLIFYHIFFLIANYKVGIIDSVRKTQILLVIF